MVTSRLKEAKRVSKPRISKIEQKNSAKVARLRLKKEPIPKGSGKTPDFSVKEQSFCHPWVNIKAPKLTRSISSARS